ncbi:DsbA family protein [Manganibacter manganicus]|uniref:Disulfide bond formation protein DsbA n=1 Tax=Manganibacter manganicus TaxID=1873176 RepID=A0A1V8RRN4_9HYPH|nr:DsbA family protein [Pseudaminobacter manganicus]OQM75649.1 disulfide bond formation protein DsbA [Pseudaminobacter manganicus]
MKRRNLILGIAATGVVASYPALLSAQPTPEALLEPGPLPEKSFGPDDAPVTIIEYASLTCPHCRTFHVNVWPELKKKYVDAGQVRFIMREFSFDPRSSAGFMLARCVGDDKWYPTIDLLYRTQDNWARVADGTGALKSVMGMTGMSTADFEKCLQDQALLEQVTAVTDAGKSFGVDSTPTFFINGEMQKGTLSIERFSEIIDPLIAAAKQ